MLKQALGLIECAGLTAAVEAADTAVKSANVTLVGYELACGDGWTTVKILGDVGAVKAAVQSAKAAASNVNAVVATQVIARPAESLEALVINKRTLGSMPGARADVKGNSPLSASYVPPKPKEAPAAEAAKDVPSVKPDEPVEAEPKPVAPEAEKAEAEKPEAEPKPAEPEAEKPAEPKPQPKASAPASKRSRRGRRGSSSTSGSNQAPSKPTDDGKKPQEGSSEGSED